MLGPRGLAERVAVGKGTPTPSPPGRRARLGLAGRDAEGHRHRLHAGSASGSNTGLEQSISHTALGAEPPGTSQGCRQLAQAGQGVTSRAGCPAHHPTNHSPHRR